MTSNAALPDAMTDMITRAMPPPAPGQEACTTAVAALELVGRLAQTTITTDEAARLRAEVATLRAEVAALRDRPLFRLPPESKGFLERLKSRKFLLAVAGVPIAWMADKLGVDANIIITGIGLLATAIIAIAYEDGKQAEASKPAAPTPPGEGT
jgi:hypothetical protein